VIKYCCHIKSPWIEESIDDLNEKISTLRESGQALLDSCSFADNNGQPSSSLNGVTNAACSIIEDDDVVAASSSHNNHHHHSA
jgi:hypothetical protein